MAIYHLRASVISRSQGRSATASTAYRSAERIVDRRTGLVFDYAARGGVDHAEILAPDHAPDWVRDRSELWNRAEEAETRKNSQVAREIRVALPSELSHDQRVALVREFARSAFVERGMVADIALHAPGREGDDRNHHAHILLTTREVDAEGSVPGGGFTTKNRDWNKVEVLEGWREAWGRDTNMALERAHVVERVDHRTLVAQRDEALGLASVARERGDARAELQEMVRAVELDRPPLPQLSPGAWQMKERGIEVGRVGAWHEARARAAEVREIARDLGRQVRDWIGEHLDRAAERVLEKVRPARPGLAYEGGQSLGRSGPDRADGAGREAGSDREGAGQEARDRGDLVARLRAGLEAHGRGEAAWGAERDVGAGREDREAVERERDASPEDRAARLRAALSGIDRDRLAEGVAALRESREGDEREAAQEAARVREVELAKVREREALEKVRERSRSRGLDYGL